jgi:hypothetical protein
VDRAHRATAPRSFLHIGVPASRLWLGNGSLISREVHVGFWKCLVVTLTALLTRVFVGNGAVVRVVVLLESGQGLVNMAICGGQDGPSKRTDRREHGPIHHFAAATCS